VINPFEPQTLLGRQAELAQVCQVLKADGDLMLAGVPGSGRRRLIRYAAQKVGARVIEIDCLRAIDSHRFLYLLAQAILSHFEDTAALAVMQQWSQDQTIVLEVQASGQACLVWHGQDDWQVFRALLSLPQRLAEWLNIRIVIVFQNFPHIRSWDRSQRWERYLRQEIQQQSQVSYALIATVAEQWLDHSNLQVMMLTPLAAEEIQPWLVGAMASEGLKLEPDAIALFLEYVQGHLGDAIALARRIWLDHRGASSSATLPTTFTPIVIQPHHIHRSALALVEDLAVTFESLILLLPHSQVRVLESLALDPTDSPHSREYIQKHQLSRGGTLQGALTSLQQKGLVYGAELGYRITLPLLAFWLKHQLS